MGQYDHVPGQKIAVAKHKLYQKMSVSAEQNNDDPGHTPSSPMPGMLPNSMTFRSSSICSMSLLFLSGSVPTGRASTHFWRTVQRVGIVLPGVTELIFRERGDSLFLRTGNSASAIKEAAWSLSPADITGRTPCHSPSFRATPRQIVSRLRSSGLQTSPRMNSYSRPFWNRARSGGARSCWARSECEIVSPFHYSVVVQYQKSLRCIGFDQSSRTLTLPIDEYLCAFPVCSEKDGLIVHLFFGIARSSLLGFEELPPEFSIVLWRYPGNNGEYRRSSVPYS